ncbi:hypothetical protein [Fibrella forsythiae]|uniref:DUF3096 domain-containing protein n=1 Tax=Fibrella forsythiae TaxID=2817061 RepID=A0ABS3JQY7_9BACT|nr:hypothetical protein [Fibrella forsythiae]MBO0951599.1 hypothetical protein [Fibrella forsythiae]
MSKLPWAKYYFSFIAAALLVALLAKFVTTNVVVMPALAVGLYWLFLRGFASIKGYE